MWFTIALVKMQVTLGEFIEGADTSSSRCALLKWPDKEEVPRLLLVWVINREDSGDIT